MKTAIMQPYMFPYIGYFQMVKAVDTFVFYDDVGFIKGGWINRNKILANSKEMYITLPLDNISSNKLITETKISDNYKNRTKLLKSIEQNYKKAPFFDDTFPIIKDIIETDYPSIASFAADSVIKTAEYLGIETNFVFSSESFPETKSLERTERILEINKLLHTSTYINAIGGTELYDKEYFAKHNIPLFFIKSHSSIHYKQFSNEFVPHLSMIDVIMHNSVAETKQLLDQYDLI